MYTAKFPTSRFLILILGLSAGLSGCVSGGGSPRHSTPTTVAEPQLNAADRADKLASSGQYQAAGDAYLGLARASEGSTRGIHLLAASESYLQVRNDDIVGTARSDLDIPPEALISARNAQRQIQVESLPAGMRGRYNLVTATVEIAQGRPAEALSVLRGGGQQYATDSTRARYFLLKGKASFMAGLPLPGLYAFSQRERLISPTDQAEHQHMLWAALLSSSLDSVGNEPLAAAESGWVSLARIAQNQWTAPEVFEEQLYRWRGNYPTHPANRGIYPELLKEQMTRSGFPESVALILPFSGRFSAFADAVRDGFMTAWFRVSPSRRPKLMLYDSGDATDITGIYEAAVRDGARFVVGPLSKQAVQPFLRLADLPVPMLALNQTEDVAFSSKIWQFGLSPEEEAREVARRAILDGHRTAIALVPDNSWGQRVFAAFSEQLLASGGEIADIQAYDPSVTDYREPVRLALENSLAWYRNNYPGEPLPAAATSSRRGAPVFAADFAFMAAFPRQARLLKPQLRFHRASALPVYSTSHAFGGGVRSGERDLNGLKFCDIGWVAGADAEVVDIASREKVHQLWPADFGRHAQLHALGFDALRIIPLLSNADSGESSSIPAASGRLKIDEFGVVRRLLSWAEVVNGRSQPLPPPTYREPIVDDFITSAPD